MTEFYQITLEFVRPGPPHNQLLSPLTPYMALCGEGSPVTLHIDLEHHQLLSRLERLRYATPAGPGGRSAAVPGPVREATVAEVGQDVARIFGELRTLLAEEWRAVGEVDCKRENAETRLIHLRLVLSGSELSLIPFEIAESPPGFPGEGLQKLLQFHMPVVLTREIRRTRPVPVAWDRLLEPRILLVGAAPGNLTIPLEAHVKALRQALDPWVRHPHPKDSSQPADPSGGKSLDDVKDRLRVLPQASLEEIYDTCSRHPFTHVHILAHGDHFEFGGERRFGLALCKHRLRDRKEVVSGPRLAKALQAENADGTFRSRPLVVTLATCDSGNPGSVLVPGGSLAHDLHVAGVPWVFASQFPLTKVGSVRFIRSFYPKLLSGIDPRQALFEVRRHLFMLSEQDHDWASLVAYASIPADFEGDVTSFFERQTRRAIEVSLDGAEHNESKQDQLFKQVRHYLKRWQDRLPQGEGQLERARRAEYYGIRGATFKRIGLLFLTQDDPEEAKKYLREARAAYSTAQEQWFLDQAKYHWTATQALSLGAALKDKPSPEDLKIARKLAAKDLDSKSDALRAWAHASLAELEMLSLYHQEVGESPDPEDVLGRVVAHCRQIVRLAGEESFHVASTRRQFVRYQKYWRKKRWEHIIDAAIDALPDVPSKLPPYA